MKPQLLVTGGAGFIGSNLGLFLKERHPSWAIVAMDNLSRRGSALNVPRLQKVGIRFVRGDIQRPLDFNKIGPVSAMLECSAEPSVLSGISSGTPDFIIDNNLMGSVHCLNFAAKHKADFIFLSTSRVYPIDRLESLPYRETATRFEWTARQSVLGASARGIREEFPLEGYRSFYGATKLCSEFLTAEYRQFAGIRTLINRCGVVAGPWQMGKVDQGVAALWVARHFWKEPLSYIGYGGQGKQVRDLLHISDLCELIDLQLARLSQLNGQTFNVGGGRDVSLSLLELTDLCQKITKNKIKITQTRQNRPADLRIYLTDHAKLTAMTRWKPRRKAETIVEDIYRWIYDHPR